MVKPGINPSSLARPPRAPGQHTTRKISSGTSSSQPQGCGVLLPGQLWRRSRDYRRDPGIGTCRRTGKRRLKPPTQPRFRNGTLVASQGSRSQFCRFIKRARLRARNSCFRSMVSPCVVAPREEHLCLCIPNLRLQMPNAFFPCFRANEKHASRKSLPFLSNSLLLCIKDPAGNSPSTWTKTRDRPSQALHKSFWYPHYRAFSE